MPEPTPPAYGEQAWKDNDPTKTLSALRMAHIEKGVTADEAFTLAVEEYLKEQVALKLAKSENLKDVASAGESRQSLHIPDLLPAQCVATSNVASLSGLQTFDGYTLETEQIVLLTAQAEAKNNGPWVAAAGAWARPSEFATSASVKARSCAVINGEKYGKSEWLLNTNGTVVIGTTAQVWVELQPSSVVSSNAAEGVPLEYISHSYGNVQAFTNCSGGGLGAVRVEKRLRPITFAKHSFNGYTAQEVVSEILGTGAPWTAGERGLVIADLTQNDMRVHGTSAQGIKGYENSLRALLYLLMAKERIAFSTFSFTSGTWGENTQAQLPGGKNKTSTSTGAQYTIPFTGTACAVLLTGRNNTGGINAPIGGTAKIEVDSVVKAEVSLENACLTGTELGLVFCPVVVPLLGLSNTAHTIKVTNVGAAGTVLYAEQLLNLTEAIPPTVFVMKQLYLPEYVEEGSKAAVTLYNEALEKVVNELIAGGYPVQAIETNAGFPPEAERGPYIKQRHPNDRGFALYANNILAAANALTYRQGLNVL